MSIINIFTLCMIVVFVLGFLPCIATAFYSPVAAAMLTIAWVCVICTYSYFYALREISSNEYAEISQGVSNYPSSPATGEIREHIKAGGINKWAYNNFIEQFEPLDRLTSIISEHPDYHVSPEIKQYLTDGRFSNDINEDFIQEFNRYIFEKRRVAEKEKVINVKSALSVAN